MFISDVQPSKTLAELSVLRENCDLEAKAAQGRDGRGTVPESFWETYVAMANTDGGLVLLGLREKEDHSFEPLGLQNTAKVRKSLWDGLNNTEIVSHNLLTNQDVRLVDYDGKQVLEVYIPRSSRQQRPIYLGKNPITGTFRRNFEGDYRCDEATVRRMLAEALEESRDARLLLGFGFEDLDLGTFAAYRNEFRSTKPGHPWLSLDDRELLRQLRGWARDRQTGDEGLTLAGLLMFGQLRAILDALPNYIVDYQERPAPKTEPRWVDRVTTDGTWSGNLFDFYRKVYPKLINDLKVPFRLEQGFKRIDESHVHEALREAFVNTLIHGDYSGSVGILVVKRPDIFGFRNPGGLRLPLHVVLEGGTSDCRNRNLQKMFQLVGAGEQAGSGFPKILRAWQEQHWRKPLLRDTTQPEQAQLQLPMMSLLPQVVLDELDRRFGPGFRSLTENETLALATAVIEHKISNERLRELTDLHSTDITELLRGLVERGFLGPKGRGRWSYYVLPGDQISPTLPMLDVLLSDPKEAETSEPRNQTSEPSPPSPEQLLTLAELVRSNRKVSRTTMERIILTLCQWQFFTIKELASLLGRSGDFLQASYVTKMVKLGQLELKYPDKPNHPLQAYRTKQALQTK